MDKRTLQQIWQDLVDEAGEAAIERAAAVSVEQAEEELEEAGFDVEAERARAEAFLDELAGGSVSGVRLARKPRKPGSR